MKKTVELQADGSFKVYTPTPYITASYKDMGGEPTKEELEDTRHRLEQDVLFLRNVLHLLRITNDQAQRAGYTLNIQTGEDLRNIAYYRKDISHEMMMAILNHKW